MRDQLPEFYLPSRTDTENLYKSGTIVLDANVLLSLYRTSAERRTQVLDLLAKIGERLWIPYQAALEFQRNRLGVIRQQAAVYSEITKAFTDAQEKAELALAKVRDHDQLQSKAKDLIQEAVASIENQVESLQKELSIGLAGAIHDDPVREALDKLLAGRVATKPAEHVLEERVREGLKRSKAGVPPGLGDEGKEADARIAGDYLVWCEILDHLEETDDPTLFVTGDEKGWFAKVGSSNVGPLPELVSEALTRSPALYHQHTFERFLKVASNLLDVPVEAETIAQVTTESTVTVSASDVSARNSELFRLLREELARDVRPVSEWYKPLGGWPEGSGPAGRASLWEAMGAASPDGPTPTNGFTAEELGGGLWHIKHDPPVGDDDAPAR